MRILALDTATTATVAGVLDLAGGLAVEARDDPPAGARPAHAAVLLGLVREALSQADGGWEGIDRIAVGIGPGTFTGLRIGVASAQALARGQTKPLVGVSTLASLAHAAADSAEPGEAVLAVIDARRGEAFAAAWSVGASRAGHAPVLEPTVLTPEELAAQASRCIQRGWHLTAVGDGAVKFRGVLEAVGAAVPGDDSPGHRVSALWHCRLAEAAVPQPPRAIQPEYLRIPDAERQP